MSALSGIFDFIVRMVPGLLLGAGSFFLLRLLRGHFLPCYSVSPPLRDGTLFIFTLFCGGLAILTLTPRWFDWRILLRTPLSSLPPFFTIGTINFIPFQTLRSDPWSLMILVGNIVMFLPLGLFPSLLFPSFSFRKALLCCLVIPTFIEFSQLFVGRSFDVDDLFLNVLGILLGRLLFTLLPVGFTARFRPSTPK